MGHITIQSQIMIKFLLQNLDQALTSKSQPNISISSQTNCREISDGVSESVSDKGSQCRQLNQFFSNIENLFTIQILPELQLQSLDQTLCSKSEQKFSFMTIPQFPNLQQTVADTILIIKSTKQESVSESVSQSVSDKHSQTVTTSFELPSSHARVTSIKFTKRESVS